MKTKFIFYSLFFSLGLAFMITTHISNNFEKHHQNNQMYLSKGYGDLSEKIITPTVVNTTYNPLPKTPPGGPSPCAFAASGTCVL